MTKLFKFLCVVCIGKQHRENLHKKFAINWKKLQFKLGCFEINFSKYKANTSNPKQQLIK